MSRTNHRRKTEKRTPHVAGFIPGPPYHIDAESLCLSDSLGQRPNLDPIRYVEWAVSKLADPDFQLEYVCRTCETWVPTRLNRPLRAGASDPTGSCFGCWYGHLDGHQVDFASVDRDAAFGAWASARADISNLELARSRAASQEAKQRLDTKIKKAYKRLKRAVDICRRRGFAPASAKKGSHPLSPGVHAEIERRHLNNIYDKEHGLATCSTCSSWCFDENLSRGQKEQRGYCWAKDGQHTKASYGCPDYRLAPR